MKNRPKISWREAFNTQPGPQNLKEAFILIIKGVCMGTADIIPGVSGGTIALITGIYQNLLEAIRSVGCECLSHLFRLNIKQAIAVVHVRFLIPLLFGIGLALISLARLMNYLIRTHPEPTWAFFLGLISASIFIIGKRIENWLGTGGISFAAGAIAGYFIVGMIPVSTPETGWFIFISGMIAICAMILPGLSGAFLLLIIGKYEYITGALKNPLESANLLILAVFAAGCVVGIAGFSRLLSYFFRHYYNTAIAALTGLMIGSIRKIWPWKEVLETKVIRGKLYILHEQNVFPAEINSTFFLACGLALLGLILVFSLEKLAHEK
jgi:putative membrane protein